MILMVVGGGGREHAIISALKQNSAVEKIYALPGNGGIAELAECVDISATDIDAQVQFALDNGVDFAVVAPDDPLVLGAVDALEAAGVPTFGPNAAAAIIEGSKSFAKDLMASRNIPTAASEVFTDQDAALAYLAKRSDSQFPVVIKADGLALGKGVIIALNRAEANDAVRSMMSDHAFGDAGKQIVIEEFLTGPEVTVLAFTDGETVVPMVASMDHKRALDGDQGPNTGGMGVIAPNPYYTDQIAQQCMEQIFLPTIEAMRELGRPFKGCLYFGLMLTPDGPKVIEYNCRFGDPEAQAVLPLLKTDLLTVMQAVRDQKLAETPIEFSDQASCCVVLASGGYPGSYPKGGPITIAELPANTQVFHAGTSRDQDGQLVTNGGRVIAVTALADTLPDAISLAYQGAEKVQFAGQHSRTDIGALALKASPGATN